MNRARDEIDDAALEALMAELRDRADPPGPDLLGRVMADAQAVQAGFAQAAPDPAPDPAAWRRGAWIGRLLDALGGWKGVSTLAASACVGLVVGLAQPETFAGFMPALSGGADSLGTGDTLALFDPFYDEATITGEDL